MLQELSIQRVSQKLALKEKKIFESLSGYKNLNEKFEPYNPFNLDPQEIRLIISDDISCISNLGSVAYPLEDNLWNKGQIILEDGPDENGSRKTEWVNKVLNDVGVGATDSSTIRHNLHLNLLYAYTQVAVFLRKYGKYFEEIIDDIKVGDELYFENNGLKLFEDEHYQIWNWDLTLKLLEERFYEHTPFILFLDESLSISYARNYTTDRRRLLLDSLKSYLRKLGELNVIPVAVYFSLDRGLVNCGLKCTLCKNIKCSNCTRISEQEKLFKTFCDKYFLYNVLTKNYSRTPYFRPLNSVVADSVEKLNIDLIAFYVRVDESILRVEFPRIFLEGNEEVVDLIHKAIVADSILSEGYPLTLSRAHELAVLSGRDRNVVHEIVYDKALELCKKYGYNLELKFSKKSELKVRGVV
ncbi:MAG: DNA double-strand break repair nuclease NurA [Nitrososphaeria archaeon]